MEIKTLTDIYMDENTYFIVENGKSIVIDPGSEAKDILAFAGDIEIKYIFLTHCHYDHMKGVNELREKTGALVCATSECAENIKRPEINLSGAWLKNDIIIENTGIILTEENDFEFEGIKIKTIKTPGHTNCSACFMVENNLFAGDTLFLQTTGRWDLPTGDENTLRKSIREKLYTLDEGIDVYPGHGKKTSIGYEKKFNFLVRE